MTDPATIDVATKIDFSKGFQGFHIQWPLKDLIVPKESSQFETTVICGDQSVVLSWSLHIKKQSKDLSKTWFGPGLKTSDKVIPIIYRVSLSSPKTVLVDGSSSAILDGTLNYGQVLPTSEVEKFVNDSGLMLNYWIDIPKAVALGSNSRKRKLEEPNGSLAEFVLDAAKMFSRVVGTEPDASSDVALIIVDKDDNEIRRFHCHTIFLLARSTVFERMFASDKWKENCSKNDRSVKIDDISEQVMETVLRFIYTSAIPDISTENAHLRDVIYAADKYNLESLKNWCITCLICVHGDIASRYEQLVLADRHNLVQLKSFCLAHLSMCFPVAFSDQAKVGDLDSELWSELTKAVSERQPKTTNIVLPAA